LGNALFRAGERESGTTKLDEAVTAFRESLKERVRERLPLDWAQGVGNEGVALLLIAERRRDVTMAETAHSQISAAFETLRESGSARSARYYELQMLRGQALVARLRGQ
jgi:hypothetical protein